jgi:hypothetical protein
MSLSLSFSSNAASTSTYLADRQPMTFLLFAYGQTELPLQECPRFKGSK